MFFLGKKPKPDAGAAATTKVRGQAAEDQALAYLQARGLRLLERNYRTPGRGGGEIDLILQEADGTVVFVEVRSRSSTGFGGAGSSIGMAKRRRVAQAAQHWLMRQGRSCNQCPCRFDAVLLDGAHMQWLQGAWEV